MDIIVDIQGMRDKDHRFLPKEIAVVARDHPFSMHWIVAPPYAFAELPPEVRTENKFLTLNFHGLEWYEGDATYKQVYANLREIARYSKNIYARGHEKTNLLSQVMTREVIDLEKEEWECPSFKSLPATCSRCLRHSMCVEKLRIRCALTQALKLKKFLQSVSYERGLAGRENADEKDEFNDATLIECDGCSSCINTISRPEAAIDLSQKDSKKRKSI